jgi:hypothetical protein
MATFSATTGKEFGTHLTERDGSGYTLIPSRPFLSLAASFYFRLASMNKPMVSRIRIGVFVLLALLGGTLVAGCGKPTGEVTGTVSYDGKNLTEGTVTFTSESGGSAFATIENNGHYAAKKVPVGKVIVSVKASSNTDAEKLKAMQNPKSPEEMKKLMMPQVQKGKSGIPKKYQSPDSSDLSLDVKPGPQEYDIPLKK